MIVDKILIEGSYQPDLSTFDGSKFNIVGFCIDLGGETYTLSVVEIVDDKKQAYRNELRDKLEQYTRLSLIGENERLPELLAEIKAITLEIRERYPD